MIDVIVKYDKDSNMLYNKEGLYLGTVPAGIDIEEYENTKENYVDNLIKLKDAGFGTEDILQLNSRDLI